MPASGAHIERTRTDQGSEDDPTGDSGGEVMERHRQILAALALVTTAALPANHVEAQGLQQARGLRRPGQDARRDDTAYTLAWLTSPVTPHD